MIVLAPKPHQESVTDIKDFIWRICVSYRRLNSINELFEFPIPQCDDAVTVLGIQTGEDLFFISLDAKQGYHQILVRKEDRQKLAFFAPDGNKYTFRVMPFGPTNAPGFYTCMMGEFKDDWETLFMEIVSKTDTLKGQQLKLINDNQIECAGRQVQVGSKVIIDDILLYSTNMDVLLIYLECVC